MAYNLISTVTVGAGGSATIDFTSIPQTFTDLVLVCSPRATSTTAPVTISLNGSATSFATRYLTGNGTAASSTTGTTFIGNSSISTDTANTFGSLTLTIPNYTSTTVNKAFTVDVVTENNATTAFGYITAGLWSSTAAVSQVTLNLANFAQFSIATLYGIN